MKRLFTLLFFVISFQSYSQSLSQTFEGNNFRWIQNTNGSLFFDQDNIDPGLEVPIGQNNFSIFASTFWVGGLNESDELKIHYRRFCLGDFENCENLWGPLQNGATPSPSNYAEQFNRIWNVTTEETEVHSQYFECLQNPDCDINETFPNGYDIPESFLSWPAHGDTLLGYDFYLAPFFDSNADNVYNAEDGDHPIFCGDFATYLITNDIGTQDAMFDSLGIGIEIHTQVYGFNEESGSLFNTLFVQQKVINRGNTTLSDSYVASWVDFDLGNFIDDRAATDVKRSMFYVYNGDLDDDGSSSGPGYGTDLPAMGVRFLGGPFADADGQDNPQLSSEYDTYGNQSTGYGDGLIDNERLGLYSSLSHNNVFGPTATQDPISPVHYYNYMRAIWKNGIPLSYGGIGFSPLGDAITARYMLSGTSDPLFIGTNEIDPGYSLEGGWTEENEDIEPGDRRIVGSSGPFIFASGDVQYLDYAYIFARESFDENETVIETLQRYADEIVGMECGQLPPIILSSKFEEASKLGIEIFPNPAQNLVNFRFSERYKNIEIEIRDLNGRLVSHNRYGLINQIEQELNFAPGVYIVRVFADDKVGTSKLVITE